MSGIPLQAVVGVIIVPRIRPYSCKQLNYRVVNDLRFSEPIFAGVGPGNLSFSFGAG
jgi:hypothetical protein